MTDAEHSKNEFKLHNLLSGVSDGLMQTQLQMNEVEQSIFGWLAGAKMQHAIPVELHKLDAAVQAVGEIAEFLEALVATIPDDVVIEAGDAIDQIRLGDLRSRIDPARKNPGIGPDRSAIELF